MGKRRNNWISGKEMFVLVLLCSLVLLLGFANCQQWRLNERFKEELRRFNNRGCSHGRHHLLRDLRRIEQ
jgi:hypothetical protein